MYLKLIEKKSSNLRKKSIPINFSLSSNTRKNKGRRQKDLNLGQIGEKGGMRLNSFITKSTGGGYSYEHGMKSGSNELIELFKSSRLNNFVVCINKLKNKSIGIPRFFSLSKAK